MKVQLVVTGTFQGVLREIRGDRFTGRYKLYFRREVGPGLVENIPSRGLLILLYTEVIRYLTTKFGGLHAHNKQR